MNQIFSPLVARVRQDSGREFEATGWDRVDRTVLKAKTHLAAAQGIMPTPPDFSKPSYAPDRGRLAELVNLAEAGDSAALKAYAINIYYSAAIELDRFRHRAILAIEAKAA